MVTPNVTVDYHEFQINEKITKAIQNRIQSGLLVGATIVEDEAKKLAPYHFRDQIQHTPVQKVNDTTYRVTVFVRIKDAPDAGAWEYGSGLHRTRTPAATYSIDAKDATNLFFWWEKKGKWFLGPHVNHPGIVARPYLHPALFNNLDRIKKTLGKLTP